ncbi:hypothetical protein EZV62_001868 [Acer yangbiense]|uniref:Uncharacterized protein n=1 Tax=Acer yangbiense TaxID=1000413 RepID=A0A5C7IW32_9ROSI|nr:hypothetical protein EZV62_001868 [Acer yangbiense]
MDSSYTNFFFLSNLVVEVNGQTENHKMEALQQVCKKKGGASHEESSASLDHCAEIAIADTGDKEKQEKTLLSSHDMKGNMELTFELSVRCAEQMG